jgi:hypothetical protein
MSLAVTDAARLLKNICPKKVVPGLPFFAKEAIFPPGHKNDESKAPCW